MADDTLQSGTDTISTDHVTTLNGVAVTQLPTSPKVQRTKATFGDDGISRDVSAAFPLPTMNPDDLATGSISATDLIVPAHGGAGVLLTGTPTALSYVALALPGGEGSWVVQLTGTFGAGTVWFECSTNSTNGVDGSWTTLSLRTLGTNTTVINESSLIAGLFRGNTAGMAWVRVRITGATTPSVAVVMRCSSADGPTALNAPLPPGANRIGEVLFRASDLGVTATAATGVAVTLTLPAAGAGLFHYISGMRLTLYSTAARTGVATPILVTSTNMPGAPVFTFATAGVIGALERVLEDFVLPVKSSAANTATTVAAPIVTGGLWRLNVQYYVGL